MNALDDFARKCRLWRDEFLLEELKKGPTGYAHLEYFAAIQAEALRRGLASAAAPPATAAPTSPAPPPTVRLAEESWIWGAAFNLVLALLFALASKVAPALAPVLGALAVGSLGFSTVPIWRRATRYSGERIWVVVTKVALGLGWLTVLYILAPIVGEFLLRAVAGGFLWAP